MLSRNILDKFTVDYFDMKYKQVAAVTTDTTGGVVIPNGETVGLTKFRAS